VEIIGNQVGAYAPTGAVPTASAQELQSHFLNR